MVEDNEIIAEKIPPAGDIYVLMKNDYRISRNIRAQWFLNNLNKVVSISPKISEDDCIEEIEIISAITSQSKICDKEAQNGTVKALITSDTRVLFLSGCYRLVFCIDLSPSVASVDCQHGNLHLEEIYPTLKQSLENVCQMFCIPGSQFLFQPKLYITIMAHLPHSAYNVPQILIQGWVLKPDNVHILLEKLEKSMGDIAAYDAKVSSKTADDFNRVPRSPEYLANSSLNNNQDSNSSKAHQILNAESSTMNLLRYGILALQLLPENSSAGLVVITDGFISFPNAQMQDSILSQLRNSTISCSFLQTGSPYQPSSCFGRNPYSELMQFISSTTCGAYFPSTVGMMMNIQCDKPNAFHEAFLYWSFQTIGMPDFFKEYKPFSSELSYWSVDNPHFYSVSNQSRVRKKHLEGVLKAPFETVLSCRLREGYTVKSVLFDEGKNTIEVRLLLPWNLSTNFEYVIKSNLAQSNYSHRSSSDPFVPSCSYELIVDGCYEFLHDVTCSDKKPIRSHFRAIVIKQFWSYVNNLSHTDNILIQLNSFTLSPAHYTIPESIKNGVPLLYLHANSSSLVPSSKSMAHSAFTSFWKPLFTLDVNVWQKWMHTYRIGIILQHDMPLPKNLHLPNASGRYLHIQCRQAITSLNSLLTDYSSFVLVENHFYIKFLYNGTDKPPTSFYVIRVTSKAPCMVIRLAFLGGLPGHQRHEIVKDLRDRICNLRLLRRISQKEHQLSESSLQNSTCDVNCCFVLSKPIEKILIRYDKLPENFVTSIADNQTYSQRSPRPVADGGGLNMLVTLSKYLHHQRWVWSMQRGFNSSLTLPTVSRILCVLTKIKLKQGFHFSHSNFGITYMMKEMQMKVSTSDPEFSSMEYSDLSPCVVQYVMFPPHTNTTFRDSMSEEEDSELPESDGELQLITECWVEPQYGVTSLDNCSENLNRIPYQEIANTFYKEDWECISNLTTFEHLCTMCQKKESADSSPKMASTAVETTELNDVGELSASSMVSDAIPSATPLLSQLHNSSVNLVPYSFNIINFLRRCHQTELLFPTFYYSEDMSQHCKGIAKSNELLVEEFLKNVMLSQDKELLLSDEDCRDFLLQVHHRPNHGDKYPFPHFTETDECSICVKLSEEITKKSIDSKDKPISKWRCFLKGCSSSHFIITFVPASYTDLKGLVCQQYPSDSDETAPCDVESEIQESSSTKIANSPLLLPVYTYDSSLSFVMNQLIEGNKNCYKFDFFESYTFKYDDTRILQQSKVENVNTVSQIAEKQKGKKYDRTLIKSYHMLIDKVFSKSFVYAVYRALVLDLPIDELDTMASIGEICEESLLEVDITDFIYTICGHIKDFTVKQSVKQYLALEKTNDAQHSDSTERMQLNFPLALLQRHQPCEQLLQKHLDIKEKFCDILKCFLKKIPSKPNYYVFCFSDASKETNLNNSQLETKTEDEANETCDISNEKELINNVTNPEEISNPNIQTKENIRSSLSSLEEDPVLSSVQKDDPSPPLFVHLLCSIKSKQGEKSLTNCPIVSIPTCLNDLHDCLTAEHTEINLDDFSILLNITCSTLPNDIENPSVTLNRQYSTSFSSNSPIPEVTRCKPEIVKEGSRSSSESLSETLQGVPLSNVPSHQREGVFKCIEKVKWLLLDEKAAGALNSYPITSETLNMVANHVRNAEDNTYCKVKEVPLKFVFGPESSVEKFIQVFKRLTLSGYHLNEEDSFYYLALNAEQVEKQNHGFSSLKPPLGIASKYLIVKQNLHCDDNTQLKKACAEEPVSFESSHEHSEKYANTPILTNLRKRRQLHQEDDTETEDGHSPYVFKTRFAKKPNSKNSKNKSSFVQRLNSVPSLQQMVSGCLMKKSRSLPMCLNLVGKEDFSAEDQGTSSQSVGISMESVSKARDNDFGNLLPESLPLWISELPTSTQEWGMPIGQETSARSVSSIPSTAKSRLTDVADSPQFYSDLEYTSIFGSRHFSNTEDGYDGDSSDTNSEWDWLSALDNKRPVLPHFWLIMTVDTSKVTIYFHIRHRRETEEEDEELKQSYSVLSQTISVITNICKEVNQMLLLQKLHESRMCDQLLVPEENNDIYKKNELDHLIGTLNACKPYLEDNTNINDAIENHLDESLLFMPGAFSCDVVWVTHFKLHHRLTTGHSAHKSKGIQAFRAALNSFSVNNRENMFVYQDNAGYVFYFRLYETVCDNDHSTFKLKTEGSLSPSGSCCSAAQYRKFYPENENEGEFRSRVNSNHSDVDREDSMTNVSSKLTPRCIALFVHGIGEVGTEIKVELVAALQSKLNEYVLDMIIMMLSRNPLCKLTPEDVQFIQNPSQPPVSEIHFTIPVKLLCYAHSIHMYLRQNMLHFLYNPKYADTRRDTHFKAFSRNACEWTHVDDNDIFLYHSHQASGFSGSKGIACIILSLVTGQGHPFEHLSDSLLNPSAYQDGLSENDFEELTSTHIHVLKKSKTPGPVALIRFQMWNVGKDNVEQIETRLHSAVRHALWDLLMEYRVLTAPVSDAIIEDVSPCSEPTTPIKTRKSGRTAIEYALKAKEFSSPLSLYGSNEISTSVPDIAAKTQSPAVQSTGVFQFNTGPQSAKAETSPEKLLPKARESHSPVIDNSGRCNLNYIFHSVMKSFLQFGSQLGCPALSEHIFNLPSRHCVSIVLSEILNLTKVTDRELNFRPFIRVTNAMNADTEFVPYTINADMINDSDNQKPGTEQNFIIVGRNNKQWNAYLGTADFAHFHESYSEALKSYQRFQTHACTPSSPEKLQESTPASPLSVGQSHFFTAVSSPRVKSPGIVSADLSVSQSSTLPIFVPRQRLLLMFIQDKIISLFLYNWSQDVTASFLKQLTKLIEWHDSRNLLLNNLVVQKMGLFNGQTSLEHLDQKADKADKSDTHHKQGAANTPMSWKMAEQLFMNSSPPREMQSSASTSSRTSSLSTGVPSVLEVLKNTRPPVPLHNSKHSTLSDPVKTHGVQVQDIRNVQKRGRDMQELRAMWQARDTNFHNLYVDRLLPLLKRACRLSHYCLTPILFSPSWRWKVAPIRDHTVQPLEMSPIGLDKSPSDSSVSVNTQRSRHSSGSSIKNTESTINSTISASRSRRASGAAVLASATQGGSPKIRMKNPSEETWHQTVCSHYLMEYMQYLQTLGFSSLQTKEPIIGPKRPTNDSENKVPKVSGSPLEKSNIWGPFYLIRYLLGGLLLFEVGIYDPYASAHLYTIDCSRLDLDGSMRSYSSRQFTSAFLDEVDKMKFMLHLHSFTYDYHLRTIHSYVSGRQLIFKHGYHLTSFLDDFIKYYQKSPNGARNLLYAGTIFITEINMSGHQLYNYTISHNQLYGMTVLRMVPIISESTSVMNTEFVLVELSSRKASYKDSNDTCQMGSFDIALLINHNIEDTSTDRNTLALNYYIILTSQRDLFPKAESSFGATLGSFQTVRVAPSQTSSALSSRKTSTVSLINEKDKFESSGEETSSNSSDSRSRKGTSVTGITDEEVTYLGYFSSQETMMQEVLLTEAETAQTHLTGVFHRASIDCRRDYLWSAFLPRSLLEKDNTGKDSHSSTISYSEFSELLNLMTSIPLDDIDPSLTSLLNMHISWYKKLSTILKAKYTDLYREFSCPEQTMYHIAVTNIRCPYSFMLLSINSVSKRAELNLVLREPPTGMEYTLEKPSQRFLALQSLVEEFVNVCCYHLWSSMLS